MMVSVNGPASVPLKYVIFTDLAPVPAAVSLALEEEIDL
jgi:hypothetical protein